MTGKKTDTQHVPPAARPPLIAPDRLSQPNNRPTDQGWDDGYGGGYEQQGGYGGGGYGGYPQQMQGPPGGYQGGPRDAGRPYTGPPGGADDVYARQGFPVQGPNGWVAYKSQDSGEVYYHNHNSQATQWERPADWPSAP